YSLRRYLPPSPPRRSADLETSGLNSRTGRLFSIQFSDGELSVLVPLSEGVELAQFAPLLTDPEITKIFHNAKFDLDFLNATGVADRKSTRLNSSHVKISYA